MIPEDFTLMKVGSHRSRAKLQRLAGSDYVELLPGLMDYPKSWGASEGLAAIPDDLVPDAACIKGITRSRFKGELRRPMAVR